MKIMDLLNDIENGKIEDGTIFEAIGDFFYKLIVIDKNLYCINEMTKQLEILDSKYIGRFNNGQYEIVKLSNKIKEEKKIPEKIEIYEDSEGHYFIDKHCKKIYITCDEVNFMVEEFNQLIDYIKNKGDE